ncbi:hypothetical protein B0H13DRAFT_2126015 [Mycena leptocephala]|nr:hypothetical protein B0H13DRAFT_2126015 [Mycena leptocephala]
MATFAKTTFNAARYAVSPLFDSVLQYHRAIHLAPRYLRALEPRIDLGCGTGQATAELLRPDTDSDSEDELVDIDAPLGFARVTGVDPSSKMIEAATAYAKSLGKGNALKFVQGPAESLKFLDDKSVDMRKPRTGSIGKTLWPELSRVLHHGGTVAFWVYSEFRLPQYPHLTPLITEYAQGDDPLTSLGPHWEPGRAILNNHLLDIEDPTSGWADVTRLPEPHLEPIMRKTMTWGGAGLHGYLRTFSALNRFHEQFPEDLEHAEGDIATRFLKQLMAAAEVPLGPEGEAQEVEVEWPIALVIARKELDPNDPWRARHAALNERVDAVKAAWEAKTEELPPPINVMDIVTEDLRALPAEVDEEYEGEGRERYIEMMEDQRTTLSWHQSFKQSFDTALELALETEKEIGCEDVAAGLARWLELMRAQVKVVGGPLWELDDEQAEELTDEQIGALSEEQLLGYEKADALVAIIRVAQELAEAVPEEPISDLVRGLYISASAEVTKQVEFEDGSEIRGVE